jgi:hypothetical protein
VKLACICGVALWSAVVTAGQVQVRHSEGIVHGFLALRAPDGALIANGDLIQLAQGDRVTSRLVFRFKDGSLRDETSVYTQRGAFRLVSNHLVLKGPSFPQPIDLTIDCASGQVTVRYADDHGKPKVESEHMELPPDLANGMTLTLLKNVRANAPLPALSMVVATPKPRLVKLALSSAGDETFTTGSAARKATHYVVKIEIGGMAGLVAPLLGKQPQDTHVWILSGEAPAFVKSEGPMFLGGPLWRIELVGPVWPR